MFSKLQGTADDLDDFQPPKKKAKKEKMRFCEPEDEATISEYSKAYTCKNTAANNR